MRRRLPPRGLRVLAGDRALGIPPADGKFYLGWQVEALREFCVVHDLSFTSPAGINFGRGPQLSDETRARLAEIISAFDSSGVAQAEANGWMLH